jgi:hypothetical protein
MVLMNQLVQDTSYVVLYDVGRQGYQTWRDASLPALVTIVALLLGFIARKTVRDSPEPRWRAYSRVARLVAFLGLVGTFASLIYTWHEFHQYSGALNSGKYRNTTGIVTSFVPERSDGHPRESFQLDNVRFEYSSSDVTSAFHRTVGTGGPLREGLSVRIADVDGRIVRLEAINPR